MVSIVCDAQRRHLFWLAAGMIGFVAAPLLGGCGFHPLYARQHEKNIPAELAQVRINPIGDRMGQILRNAMIDRMGGVPKRPRYALSVVLTPSSQEISSRKDNTVLRINLTVVALYHLRGFGESEQPIVFSDKARTVIGYDVLEAQYSTVVAERDAQQQAAQQLAEAIVDRLAIHFLGMHTHTGADEARKAHSKTVETP